MKRIFLFSLISYLIFPGMIFGQDKKGEKIQAGSIGESWNSELQDLRIALSFKDLTLLTAYISEKSGEKIVCQLGPLCQKILGVLKEGKEGVFWPEIDPWGHPYYFFANGEDFVLVGSGSDGKLDRDYSKFFSLKEDELLSLLCPGAQDYAGSDLIYVNGSLCSFPKLLSTKTIGLKDLSSQ